MIGLAYEYLYEWYSHLANSKWRDSDRPVADSPRFTDRLVEIPQSAMPLSPVIVPTILGLRKRFRLAAQLGKLGGILVVIGVAGELYVGTSLSITAGELRQANAALMGDLAVKSIQARLDAVAASKAAGNAIREANAVVESLRPRQLDAEQVRRIAEYLAGIPGQFTQVRVSSYSSDREGTELARQICEILDNTNRRFDSLDRVGTIPIASVPSTGILIEGHDIALVRSLGDALFRIGNLKVSINPSKMPPDPVVSINIMVGVKPLKEIKPVAER